MPSRFEVKTTRPSLSRNGPMFENASTNAPTLGASAASFAVCASVSTDGSTFGVEWAAGAGGADATGTGGAVGAGAGGGGGGAPAHAARRSSARARLISSELSHCRRDRSGRERLLRRRRRAIPGDALHAEVRVAAVGRGVALLELVRAARRRRHALQHGAAVGVHLPAEAVAALVTRVARHAVLLARVERPEAAHVAG